MKYNLMCRYQYRGSKGITWTNWFPVEMNIDTEDSLDTLLEKKNLNTKEIDKLLGMKHEFRLENC